MPKEKDLEYHIELIEEFLTDPEHAHHSDSEVARSLKKIAKEDETVFNDFLQKIPNEHLGDIALELPEKYLKDFIEYLPKNDLVEVVEELDSDDATDLLQDIEDIDSDKADEILAALDEEDQEEIKKLRKYDEDSAGAIMQTELFSANYEEVIQDSINRLKEDKKKGELNNVHQVFITGAFEKLIFAISLEDILTFDFKKTYQEVLLENEEHYKPRYARDDDKLEDLATLFKEHDLSVVPVVNHQGELIGRITSDDIYDVMQESATEQIYNLAGVDDEAEEEENFFQAGRKRGSWLFLNLLTAIAASLVIQMFDETIQSFVALAILMPIVSSMGGNAGTQTLTVTVRRLALGEIELENAKETIKKEVMLSLANGLIFAVILGFISYFWFGEQLLGVIIAASMVINLFAAGFFGAVIPLALKRFHVDPAVGSTVLLTTVTDVVGFFSFLGLASWLLVK
ncbi:MAG TPA: magnesium transporter [Campylobacterales bacterium]|nr:magnesium transporter [Campylobacterales bacterium]